MWARLLILAAVIWLVIWIMTRIRAPRRTGQNTPVATMVRCEYCHLFLPQGEAVVSGTHYYCSEEHKSLAQK